LKASAPARIVNVASTAHFRGRINFDDLQGAQRYRMWTAYGQSKLANILFTYALARRLEGQGVTVNCLHPGVVATGFAANVGPLEKLLAPLINLFFISAEQGAKTSIHLASAPEVATISGAYFDRSAIARSSDLSRDVHLQEQVWALSLAQVGHDLF
jgi:retinol dehydrogenase 12